MAHLVVEDGSGKSDSDSYIPISEAESYMDDFGLAWPDNYGEHEKEIGLRLGTQHIDKTYRTRLQGSRVTKEQALDWPRIGVTIAGGRFNIDSNEIPDDLKRATVHAAVSVANQATTSLGPDKTDPGRVKVEKVKIDVIEIETEWSQSKDDEVEYTMVDRLMAQFLGAGDRVIRS